jgi:ribosomal protein S12 methylthiotransferase accessory factor
MSDKAFLRGTHRVCSPEETWERIQPAFGPAGLTRVADVTRLDVIGIPVFQAVRPRSRNLSVSQGKGATPMAARVSAAMEALELWHAEDGSHLPRRTASTREMAADNPIRTDDLLWAMGLRQPLMDMGVDWVEAVSLVDGARGWLPTGMVELDFRYHETFHPRIFHQTSNGLASGNTRDEALVHALAEVVERDAMAKAREAPERRRLIDPDSLGTGHLAELVDRVRAAGMKLGLYDVSADGELPVVVADLALPDLPTLWRGSGCHPSAEVAASRALTEAVQTRLTYIAGARDDLPMAPRAGDPARMFERFEEIRADVSQRGAVRLDELPDVASPTVAEDRQRIEGVLVAQGRRPWVVDLDHPGLALSVVRVLVPGLEEDLHH